MAAARAVIAAAGALLLCAPSPAAAAFVPARLSLRSPNPAIEPWAYLNGGAFSGPAVPLSPDPLVAYRWSAGSNNTADLQCYDVLPATVALTAGTPASSFAGLASLTTASPSVIVSGAGGFVVDFAVEGAAWVEVDVLAASAPSPADLALVRMGLSEWAEPLQNKWHEPVAYTGGAAGLVTLRLETSKPGPELYEGVRFGYFNISAPPSAAFTIVGMRAVSQAKQVNYEGTFSSAGDDLLTRIWYTAAYSVRVNLERDYFGAVLVNRGDRESWVRSSSRSVRRQWRWLSRSPRHSLTRPLRSLRHSLSRPVSLTPDRPATHTSRRPRAWRRSATSPSCSITCSAP